MILEKIKTLLADYPFEVESIKKLEGYDTTNYRIDTPLSMRYLLKLYPYTKETWEDLNQENHIIGTIQTRFNVTMTFPIANNSGKFLPIHDEQIVRVLMFVPGEFFGDIGVNPKILASLGNTMARFNKESMQLSAGVLGLRKSQWDLDYFSWNKDYLKHVDNRSMRSLMHYYFNQHKEFVEDKIPHLRKCIIHHDFNDWNVLLVDDEVNGLIDFGDMVHSSLINELAVGLAYALCYSDNLLEDASTMIEAYHQVLPLEKKELDILYHLTAARMVTSLCNSAKKKANETDSTYITISEKPFQKLLLEWIKISPVAFLEVGYIACGLSANDHKSSKELQISRREKHFSNSLSLSYETPIHMQSAAFQYMYDQDGRTYLDAYNNIPLVGHCHPRISEVISRQSSTLNTNTRYHYNLLGEYAEKLLSLFPDHLNKVFFVNSGSAASDLAIRMATTHAQKPSIFVLEDGYHGNTKLGIEISPYKHDGKGGPGTKNHIHKFPLPKEFGSQKTGLTFAREAKEKIQQYKDRGIHPAAFIAEPISGCGGQVPLAKSYLKEVFEEVKSVDGLCIVDEVQTGFGRLGSWTWGFEMHEVKPDIVILGKPIGNGHPIGAVVCTEEVARSFETGMEFFSSFGGNPVSCAVGLEVLQILEDENLQMHAKSTGDHWKASIRSLQEKYPMIGDVRGEGLFLGIEMMDGKQPGTKLAHQIKNAMKHQFVLSSTDGKHDNVIKIKPPLCFNKDNVDEFVHKLENSLSQLS